MAENQKLRPDANELRALVHTSQAGAIIGKGGERVKELRYDRTCVVRMTSYHLYF
jgi:ribosomal protein S3